MGPPRLLYQGPTFPSPDFRALPTVNDTLYKARIHRLVSPMPWEPPSQSNAYLQPLVEAAVYTYMNWTNKEPRNAQQFVKVRPETVGAFD